MPDQQVPDFLGNLVSVGDRVVVVFREEQVRVGTVAEFSSRMYLGHDTPTMAVNWEKCTGGMPSKRTSAVHLHARIFLKLFPEK
jgi:hypothetical protein